MTGHPICNPHNKRLCQRHKVMILLGNHSYHWISCWWMSQIWQTTRNWSDTPHALGRCAVPFIVESLNKISQLNATIFSDPILSNIGSPSWSDQMDILTYTQLCEVMDPSMHDWILNHHMDQVGWILCEDELGGYTGQWVTHTWINIYLLYAPIMWIIHADGTSRSGQSINQYMWF